MYRKILVPLDGSQLAERILPHAETIARGAGAELVLFRVPVYAFDGASLAPPVYGRTPLPSPSERMSAMEEARSYLNKVKDNLIGRGLRVTVEVLEGEPAEAITHFVLTAGVDLIAMSTHGRTGLSRVLFGSVAEQVLRGGAKPVLLIRPEA